eukprot:bmy_16345T0
MSDSLVVCEVDPELKEKLRKFRFRKETDNAAIISSWSTATSTRTLTAECPTPCVSSSPAPWAASLNNR